MWLAEKWDAVVVPFDNASGHPTRIRQAHREATKGDGRATQPLRSEAPRLKMCRGTLLVPPSMHSPTVAR
jgi:hypothetical protein